MALYAQFPNGDVLSLFPQRVDAMFDAVRGLERGTVEPTITPTGLLWFRTNEPVLGDAIKWWNGAAFQLLLDPEFPQVNAGGSVAFSANQPMGNHKLTGLAAGSGAGDSVRWEQVLLLAGGTMTGDIVLGGAATITGFSTSLDLNAQEIVNLAAPTAADSAARKADVDQAAPVAGTFTTTTGSTATATITLGWAPAHLIIAMDTASGPSDTVMVQAPGASANETVGGLTSSGRVGVTITRNATQFTVSFANPSPGNALNGRYLVWRN